MSSHLNRNNTPSPLHAAATATASSVTGVTPTARAHVAGDHDDIAYTLMYRSIRDSSGASMPLIDEVRRCLLRYRRNTPCPSNDAVLACLNSLPSSLYDTLEARRSLANDAEDAHIRELARNVPAANATTQAAADNRYLPAILQGIWQGMINREDACWACYEQGILPYNAWNGI